MNKFYSFVNFRTFCIYLIPNFQSAEQKKRSSASEALHSISKYISGEGRVVLIWPVGSCVRIYVWVICSIWRKKIAFVCISSDKHVGLVCFVYASNEIIIVSLNNQSPSVQRMKVFVVCCVYCAQNLSFLLWKLFY